MTDFEFLLLLRENTILDPISYLKVRKLRKLAEDYQIVINSKEHCNLGVDYSKANELETELRYKIWYDKTRASWLRYGDGQDNDEFALRLLCDASSNQKKLLKK